MASFKTATHDTLRWQTTQMNHNGGRWRHEQLQSALAAQAQRTGHATTSTGTTHIARKADAAAANTARMNKLFPGRRAVKKNPNSSQMSGGMVPISKFGDSTFALDARANAFTHHKHIDPTASGVTDEVDISAGQGHEVAHYGHGHENKDTEDHFTNGLFPWSDAPEVAAPHYGNGHENKDTEDHFGEGLFVFSDRQEVDTQGYSDKHLDKDTEDHFIGGPSMLLDPNLTAEEDASAVWKKADGSKTISPTTKVWRNRRLTPAAPGMPAQPNYKTQRQQSERSKRRQTHIRKSIKSQSLSIRASREPPRY